MAENTKIEWADATVNHWAGCTKVSPACDNCYAQRMAGRLWNVQWGAGQPRRQFVSAREMLEALDRKAQRIGKRLRVFHNSLSDMFDKEVPDGWSMDAFKAMADTPNLQHLVLTKRIGNVRGMLADLAHGTDPDLSLLDMMPLPNVWIGATVVNQAEADREIPKLLEVPARVRFLSMEPLLGAVDLRLTNGLVHGCDAADYLLDWVIVGGESGPGARPMHPDWACSLRDQCQAAGVPLLFKQWGEWLPICQMSESEDRALWRSRVTAKPHEDQANLDDIYGRVCTIESSVMHLDGSVHHIVEPNAFPAGAMTIYRVGKKAAGRLLDGRTWDEVPA